MGQPLSAVFARVSKLFLSNPRDISYNIELHLGDSIGRHPPCPACRQQSHEVSVAGVLFLASVADSAMEKQLPWAAASKFFGAGLASRVFHTCRPGYGKIGHCAGIKSDYSMSLLEISFPHDICFSLSNHETE